MLSFFLHSPLEAFGYISRPVSAEPVIKLTWDPAVQTFALIKTKIRKLLRESHDCNMAYQFFCGDPFLSRALEHFVFFTYVVRMNQVRVALCTAPASPCLGEPSSLAQALPSYQPFRTKPACGVICPGVGFRCVRATKRAVSRPT